MSRKCAGCKKWLAAGQYTCPFCKRGEADLRSDLKAVNMEKLRSIFSSGVSFESEASLVLLLAPFAQGEPLPSSLCGEVVAWGSSELLLDAVVKRGCNVVDKVNLGALVAKLKGQRAVASEKAEALATREKDLKKRLLGGRGEEISELEKEALSNERKEIERLRSVAFLEKVLQACKIDDCSELVEARELVRTVTTEQPKVEAVTATPASEKETTEVTKARVGTNEDVFALSRRNLESSQDDLDEVCGDETLEKDPMVAYADIVLNEEGISINGPLCSLIKDVTVSYGDQSVCISKMGGAFSMKFKKRPDWSRPIQLQFVMFFFKRLAFQQYTWKSFTVALFLARPRRRIAVPVPFQKVKNLAADCIEVMHDPKQTAVGIDLLLVRLQKALGRFIEAEDPSRVRHALTLLRVYESMCALLHVFCNDFSVVLYDSIFNVHSLSLGFAPVFASPARFFNPNVSWRALNEKGLFVGRLFSREFDDLVSAEAFNISVNGASALVPLSRQLIRTLQEMCDLKLLSANPLIGQVVVSEVILETRELKIPNVNANDLHLYHCVEHFDFVRASQLLAFCMGRHPRLGKESVVAWLPKDVVKLIAEYIPRSLEAPFCAVFGRAKLKPERVLAERKTNRKISEKESADLETIRIRAGQSICFQPARVVMTEMSRPPSPYVQMVVSLSVCFSFPQFLELPDKILHRILSFCSIEEIGRVELCCNRRLNAVISEIYRGACDPKLASGKFTAAEFKQEAVKEVSKHRSVGFWNLNRERYRHSYCTIS